LNDFHNLASESFLYEKTIRDNTARSISSYCHLAVLLYWLEVLHKLVTANRLYIVRGLWLVILSFLCRFNWPHIFLTCDKVRDDSTYLI